MSRRGGRQSRRGVGNQAGFSPSSISGLVLWLRADMGITLSGSNVTTWADQSGNGNTCTQANPTYQPTYVASGIGGVPSLAFNGATQQLGSTTLSTANQPCTLYLVAEQNGQGTAQFPLSFGVNAGTSGGGFYNNTATTFAYLNNSESSEISVTASTIVPFIAAAVANGASSSIRVAGTIGTGTLGSGAISAGPGYYVGAISQGGNPWAGQIAEILIYTGHSALDQSVLNYLQLRYGITP